MQRWARCHIPGAVSADVSGAVSGSAVKTAEDNVKAAVEGDAEGTKYALICYTGNKYANAGRDFLRDLGISHDDIFILGQDDGTQGPNGGMKAWTTKYPEYIVSEFKSGQGVVSNAITAENLNKILKADIDTFDIMDVRAEGDYNNGHIDGAVLATCPGSGATPEAKAAVKEIVDF